MKPSQGFHKTDNNKKHKIILSDDEDDNVINVTTTTKTNNTSSPFKPTSTPSSANNIGVIRNYQKVVIPSSSTTSSNQSKLSTTINNQVVMDQNVVSTKQVPPNNNNTLSTTMKHAISSSSILQHYSSEEEELLIPTTTTSSIINNQVNTTTEDLLSSIEQSMEEILQATDEDYFNPPNVLHLSHHNSNVTQQQQQSISGVGEQGLIESTGGITDSNYSTNSTPQQLFNPFLPNTSSFSLDIPLVYTTSDEEIELSNGSISTNTTTTTIEEEFIHHYHYSSSNNSSYNNNNNNNAYNTTIIYSPASNMPFVLTNQNNGGNNNPFELVTNNGGNINNKQILSGSHNEGYHYEEEEEDEDYDDYNSNASSVDNNDHLDNDLINNYSSSTTTTNSIMKLFIKNNNNKKQQQQGINNNQGIENNNNRNNLLSTSNSTAGTASVISENVNNNKNSIIIDFNDCNNNIYEMNEKFKTIYHSIYKNNNNNITLTDLQHWISIAPSFECISFLLKENELFIFSNINFKNNLSHTIKKKMKELNNKHQSMNYQQSLLLNNNDQLNELIEIFNYFCNEEILYCILQSPIVMDINMESDVDKIILLLEKLTKENQQSFQNFFRLFDGTKRWLIHVFTHNLRIRKDYDNKLQQQVVNTVNNSSAIATSNADVISISGVSANSNVNSGNTTMLVKQGSLSSLSSNSNTSPTASILSIFQKRQRSTIDLQNFLQLINRLVELNFINENLNILLDELMLIPFFVSLNTFEFIECIGIYSNDNLNYKLKDYLIEKCKQLIIQHVNGGKQLEELFLLIQQTILNNNIRMDCLFTFLQSSNLLKNDFETIVKHPCCYHFIKFIKHSEPFLNDKNYLNIKEAVSKLQDVYYKLVFKLLDKKCDINTLNMVLKHSDQFIKIVYIMGDVGFNEENIKTLKEEFISFKTTLDAVQNFLTIFCDDPNYFETSTILDNIIQIRRNMGQMIFSKIQKQISELIPFSIQDLSFFYELRSSEFFLVLWRDLYTNMNRTITLSNYNNSYNGGTSIIQKHTVESMKLQLIPNMKKKWLAFYSGLDNLSIRLVEFQSILKRCSYCKHENLFSLNASQYEEELLKLRMTFNGQVNYNKKLSKIDEEWIKKRLNILKLIDKLNIYKNYLPSFLILIEELSKTFINIKLKKDLDYIKIKKEENILKQPFENQTLNMLEENKLNLDFNLLENWFKEFTSNQILFIKILSESTGLQIIDWLLKNKSDREFENLVEMCKSFTDSVKVLEALKSLCILRKVIGTDFLYKKNYLNLKELKYALAILKIENETIVNELRNLKKQFSLLLRMFEEKSRSSGVQALYDLAAIYEKGIYEFNINNKFIIRCRIQQQQSNQQQQVTILSLENLIELRNKLLLVEIPEKILTLDNVNERIKLFVKSCAIMIDIKSLLLDLYRQAHFDFQENNFCKELRANECTLEEIINYKNYLSNEKKEWQLLIDRARREYFYFNLFRMKEILKVYTLLQNIYQLQQTTAQNQQDQEENLLNELHFILRLGDQMITLEEVKECVKRNVIQNSNINSATEKMTFICQFIQNVFSSRTIQHQKVNVLSQKLSLAFNQQQNNTTNDQSVKIIKLTNEKEVLDAVISIYSYHNRLPLNEEVLLCNVNSNCDNNGTNNSVASNNNQTEEELEEEITLILNRWQYSKFNERKTIYCIANIHLLSYGLQSKLLLKIQEYLSFKQPTTSSSTNNSSASTLVLVSGSNSNSRLLREFSQYIDSDFKILPKKYITKIFENRVNLNVKCVTGKHSGSGKSSYILQEVYEKKQEYYRITILEDTCSSEIIKSLHDSFNNYKNINNNDKQNIAYHMNICPLVNNQLNYLFFELFYLGHVRDKQNAMIYHLNSNTSFYLEIPNTLCVPVLQENVFICQSLPQVYIEPKEDSLKLMKYELKNNDNNNGGLIINAYKDEKLQFVCKFLKAFENGVFRNANPNIPDFDPKLEKDLNSKQCLQLLCKYLKFETVDTVNFSVIQYFIHFMTGQFSNTLRYDCFKNCAMEGTMQLFKHAMIDLMIDSGRDICSTSIDINFYRNSFTKKYLGVKSYTEILLLQYIEMFEKKLDKWEDNNKHPPLVVFYQNDKDQILGIDLIGLNTDQLKLDENLKYSLVCNGIDLESPKDLTHERAQEIIRNVAGVVVNNKNNENNDKPIAANNYVLTVDNLNKLITIFRKMKYNLPIVLSGDTGVGKSSSLNYLSSILGHKMKRFVINEGHCSKDIINWLEPLIKEAMNQPLEQIIVFFDQVNMANNVALFKELICDRTLNNIAIPTNLKIVAACNPYRLRRHSGTDCNTNNTTNNLNNNENSGNTILSTKLKQSVKKPGLDLQAFAQSLVYKVYPMPISLLGFIFYFGNLDNDIEQLYIRAILKVEMNENNNNIFFDCFTKLIFHSQTFIRKVYKEKSAVSLRDVKRCIKLFKSFYASLTKRNGLSEINYNFGENINFVIKNAIMLSLGHCYYYRLSSKREEYIKELEELFEKERNTINVYSNNSNSSLNYIAYCKGDFLKILMEEQLYYTMHLNIPKGIALNNALRENIFMILVCVLNKIPIFVVGKSGSSKSLALEILASNLNGIASSDNFLRSLPSIEIFSYQCSQISTPESLKSCFDAAKRYQKNLPNAIVVVLLNEVGLLEQSISHPIKVINKELEEEESEIAVIGLSNWDLDPNIINRAVYLSRPSPNTFELKTTLSGIVTSLQLDSTLYSLAKAYNDVYKNQTRPDFYGLRDFYHTIKFINRNFNDFASLTPELLIDALARNFNGSEDFANILKIFFSCVGMSIDKSTTNNFRKSKLEYIKDNLQDTKARHLMLLTKNNESLTILFKNLLINYENSEVIFGPNNFPNNKNYNGKNELQICLDIQKIKKNMATGKCVVLVNYEQLYESLYDLFNLQYIEYDENRFVCVTLGTYSRLCSVHKNFRVIVIVDQEDAYNRLSKPLLNRFEKQTLHREDLFDKHSSINLRNILTNLQLWVKNIFGEDEKPFINYHKTLLQSLILSLDQKQIEEPTFHDYLLEKCKNALLWITTTDAMVRVLSKGKNRDLAAIYFEKQEHTDLLQFLGYLFKQLNYLNTNNQNNNNYGSDYNNLVFNEGYFQLVLFTYSSNFQLNSLLEQAQLKLNINESNSGDNKIVLSNYKIVKLDEIQSEQEFTDMIEDYFNNTKQSSSPQQSLQIEVNNNKHELLVIQCEAAITSNALIQQSKFIIEKQRLCSKQSTKGKHILFLIHSMPFIQASRNTNNANATNNSTNNSSGNGNNNIIEFDSHWCYAFIDEIKPMEPSICEILRRPFAEHVTQINLREMITKNFRASLSMLRYNTRKNTKLNDITILISRIEEMLKIEKFWEILRSKIIDICLDSFCKDLQNNYYSEHVAFHMNDYFMVSNTYYAALQYCVTRIIIKSFAYLIAEIDRNDNLSLYFTMKDKGTDGINLWLKLFKDLKKPTTLFINNNSIMKWQAVDVKSDGNNNKPFQSRFPFSFEICKHVHSLRNICERIGGNTRDTLQNHIDMLFPFLNTLPSKEYIYHFLYDYLCMFSEPCSVLSNDGQYEIVHKMLEVNDCETVAGVISFLWKQERRLQAYFTLFETLPFLLKKFRQKLFVATNLRLNSMEEMDILLFSVIHHCLDPRKVETHHSLINERRLNWVKNLIEIKSAIEVLISLIHHSVQQSQQQHTISSTTASNTNATTAINSTMSNSTTSSNSNNSTTGVNIITTSSTVTTNSTTFIKKTNLIQKNIRYILEKWQKLLFYKEYLVEIAVPLNLVKEISIILWQNMKTKSLTSLAGLDYILYFLDVIHKIETQSSKQQQLKHQSQQNHYTKRANISRFFEMFVSKFLVRRKDDEVDENFFNALVEIIKGTHQKFNEVLKTPSSTLRSIILKKLLLNRQVKPKIKNELRKIIIKELGLKQLSHSSSNRSDSKVVALLMKSRGSSTVPPLIEPLLKKEEEKEIEEINFENTITYTYLTIYESGLQHLPTEQLSELVKKIDSSLLNTNEWTDIMKEIQLIAILRSTLSQFCSRLIIAIENNENILNMINNNLLFKQLTQLLNQKPFEFLKYVLFKLIIERKGRLFLIKQFKLEVGKYLQWVNELLQNCRISDMIPQNILFHSLNGMEEIEEAVKNIIKHSTTINTTTTTTTTGANNLNSKKIKELTISLKNVMNMVSKLDNNVLKKLCFLAVIDQCYLSLNNPLNNNLLKIFTTENEANIKDLLKDNLKNLLLKHIFLKQDELRLNMTFANHFFTKDHFFSLSNTMPFEHLTLIHIILHICSIAFSNYDSDQFLYNLLFNPEMLKDKYLPSMADDIRSDVIKSFKEQNNPFSNEQWYTCMNGHVYVVDLCGLPLERSSCPECGSIIGGTEHIVHDTNQSIKFGEKVTPTGYAVYESPQEYELNHSIRNLLPASFRIIRLMIHSLLFVGMSVFHNKQYTNILHRTISTNIKENLSEHVLSHIKNDWKILIELIGEQNEEKAGVLLFHILEMFSFTSKQVESKRRVKRDLTLIEGRDNWENHFNGCVGLVLQNATKKYTSYCNYVPIRNQQSSSSSPSTSSTSPSTSSSTVGDSNNYLTKLFTNYDQQAMLLPINDPFSEMWSMKIPITYQQFKNLFLSDKQSSNSINNNKHTNRFPILSLFIHNEPILSNTCYLPNILKWQKLIISLFSRRIDRHYARTRTIRDILTDENITINENNRNAMEKLFENYAKAFNNCIKYIERYNCLPLPNWCKNIVMNKDTTLSFCIPEENDECICALALTQFLIDKHNEMIEKVNDYLQKGNNLQNNLNNNNKGGMEIASRLLSKHHLINFNIQEELMPIILESQIVNNNNHNNNTSTTNNNNNLRFDYERIEHFIINKYLSGKPKIKLELQRFYFLNENRYNTKLSMINGPLTELENKMKQIELPIDIKQNIIEDLQQESLEVNQSCLRQVEECISFLQAIGNTNLEGAENMKIIDYLRNILLLNDTQLILQKSTTIVIHVQLKHLKSLWTLLSDQLSGINDFDTCSSFIHSKYKVNLTSILQNQLIEFKNQIKKEELNILLNSMNELMLSYFTNETLDSELALKQMLEITPTIFNNTNNTTVASSSLPTSPRKLGDYHWFKLLPDSLKTCHIYHTYKFLCE